ncbi:MAG: tetratricopeptide repeat protein [Elusimicrobiota bacterium]|jgi:tetratricopeptide (TPR) repeat protein|nr:tetratricopeptide repeat protein [Elusimicrobiota bacterium]
MLLNKTLILFLLFAFACLPPANAIFGLAGRAEQKKMLADAREANAAGQYAKTIDIMEEFFFKNAPKRRVKRAYLLLAGAYRHAGMYDKLLLRLNEAAEFFPDDAEINLQLADVYMYGNLPDKAVALYEKVLTLDKKNAPARLALARAFLAEGSFLRSSVYFAQYEQMEEVEDAAVYYDYALARFSANDYQTALDLAQKARALGTNADTELLIAKICRAMGHGGTAFETLAQAAQNYPQREDIFLTRALWLAYDKETAAQAQELADAYLIDNPQDRLALFIKAYALYNQGKAGGAKANLKTIASFEGDGFIDKMAAKLQEKL